MNTAIIAAAGQGTRCDPSRPKQFLELLGKPILIHTLERFQSCPVIDEIVLVLSDEGRDEFGKISGSVEIPKLSSVVIGGQTRAKSVFNGLNEVNGTAGDVIVVHDAARPLVSVEEIARTVNKAAETGAACLVVDVTDTIKEVDGEFISRTVDRARLRRALTPQAFRYDILRKAFDGAVLSDSITDECYLVEKLGVNIALVEGGAQNIKITQGEDLILAEAFLTRQH
jgi:2-C-methyl-D-erythritol 4-phosphate cytidylyltransferase